MYKHTQDGITITFTEDTDGRYVFTLDNTKLQQLLFNTTKCRRVYKQHVKFAADAIMHILNSIRMVDNAEIKLNRHVLHDFYNISGSTQHDFEIIKTDTRCTRIPIFTVALHYNGKSYVETSPSKKLCRNRLASRALKDIQL